MSVTTLAAPAAPETVEPGRFSYFSTEWDTGRIREELPITGASFTMPVSGHGEFRGTLTVPPGQGYLRASLAPVVSGLLVCLGDRPVWSGMVWADSQTGRRRFSIAAAEWGSVFEKTVMSRPFLNSIVDGVTANVTPPLIYAKTRRDQIVANLIEAGRSWIGGGFQLDAVLVDDASGLATLTVPWYEHTTIDDSISDLAARFTNPSDRFPSPEWAFVTTGSSPDTAVRQVLIGSRLGRQSLEESGLLLEYVEDTGPAPQRPPGPPVVTTVDNLFPGLTGDAVVRGPSRTGGNVIATPGFTRDGGSAVTELVTVGAGEDTEMVYGYAVSPLLAQGWPRLGKASSHKDVRSGTQLRNLARIELAAQAGLTTEVRCTTFGSDPDWTQLQRGDLARVELDTDLHGARPYVFESRARQIAVAPSDTGGFEQVTYTLASSLEVA